MRPADAATSAMIVDCRPAARAVRWDGTNRSTVEELTGRSTMVSMLDERALIVDAWGAAQVCPFGHWVVVTKKATPQVLSQREFSTVYRICSKRTAMKAAA